jgi:nicotinamide riboside transporter PnuC
MLPANKKKTNLGVGLGIGVQIVGRIMQATGSTATATLGVLLVLAGLAIFIWGCAMYMQGKGYHPAWGLLGLLSVIGLIILAVLRDRHPEEKVSARAAVASGPQTPTVE